MEVRQVVRVEVHRQELRNVPRCELVPAWRWPGMRPGHCVESAALGSERSLERNGAGSAAAQDIQRARFVVAEVTQHWRDGVTQITGLMAEELVCGEQEHRAGGRVGRRLPQGPEDSVTEGAAAPLLDGLPGAPDMVVHVGTEGGRNEIPAHDRPGHREQGDQCDEVARQIPRGGLRYPDAGTECVQEAALVTKDLVESLRADLPVLGGWRVEPRAAGGGFRSPASGRADGAAALGWVQAKVAHAWKQRGGRGGVSRLPALWADLEQDLLVNGAGGNDGKPPQLLPA